jgi:hypothetical protein
VCKALSARQPQEQDAKVTLCSNVFQSFKIPGTIRSAQTQLQAKLPPISGVLSFSRLKGGKRLDILGVGVHRASTLGGCIELITEFYKQ